MMAKSYWGHRNNVGRHHIGWELSLPQYAEIAGPYLGQFGQGKLHLARKDKTGAFTYGNVAVMSAHDDGLLTNGFARGNKRVLERTNKLRLEARKLYDAGLSQREIAKRLKRSKITITFYLAATKNA